MDLHEAGMVMAAARVNDPIEYLLSCYNVRSRMYKPNASKDNSSLDRTLAEQSSRMKPQVILARFESTTDLLLLLLVGAAKPGFSAAGEWGESVQGEKAEDTPPVGDGMRGDFNAITLLTVVKWKVEVSIGDDSNCQLMGLEAPLPSLFQTTSWKPAITASNSRKYSAEVTSKEYSWLAMMVRRWPRQRP